MDPQEKGPAAVRRLSPRGRGGMSHPPGRTESVRIRLVDPEGGARLRRGTRGLSRARSGGRLGGEEEEEEPEEQVC